MTRDEFIAGYMQRSGIETYTVVEDTVRFVGRHVRRALPCNCGEEQCSGWQMVSVEQDDPL